MRSTLGVINFFPATISEATADGTKFPAEELKEFAQKIDRVMGAAKNMGLESSGIVFVAKVSEACKTMGYQAVALQRVNLVPIFAAFWAETIEILSEVVAGLTDPKATAARVGTHSSRLQSRLAWLASRVAPANAEEQKKVTDLLKAL